MLYWFTQISLGLLLKVLFRIKVVGLDNIPETGAFLLASNHRSYLDPILISILTYRKLFFLGKKELFTNTLFARILKGINVIPLSREGLDRAALKEALKALHKRKGLVVFPEGTRSLDGRLGAGKGGVAMLSIGGKVPVIPVFVKGSEIALPQSADFIRAGARIKVIFGKKITPPIVTHRADKKLAYQEFTDKIMQEIAGLEKRFA